MLLELLHPVSELGALALWQHLFECLLLLELFNYEILAELVLQLQFLSFLSRL